NIFFQITSNQQLSKQGHPVFAVLIATLSKKGLLVCFMGFDKGIAFSNNHVNHVFGFILFVGKLNCLDNELVLIFVFMLFFWKTHNIVHVAPLPSCIIRFFTKIMKDELSS